MSVCQRNSCRYAVCYKFCKLITFLIKLLGRYVMYRFCMICAAIDARLCVHECTVILVDRP